MEKNLIIVVCEWTTKANHNIYAYLYIDEKIHCLSDVRTLLEPTVESSWAMRLWNVSQSVVITLTRGWKIRLSLYMALPPASISAMWQRADLSKLQENLVMSHACGTGDEVKEDIVRLMLALKVKSSRTVIRESDLRRYSVWWIFQSRGNTGSL